MPEVEHLLARLDAIAASLERRDSALALLALGSVGRDRHRLDEHSDLDFFAVVRPGAKQEYLEDLGWLEDAHPLGWSFRNTRDGHKALFADGVYCEYAVFEPDEVAEAHHPGGRVGWHREGFDTSLCEPRHAPGPPEDHPMEWLVGEALSNLYVGMCRYLRGERWSAAIFVQSHALHRVADIVVKQSGGAEEGRDPYTVDRRFESRHADADALFARCMRGYERTPESALEILAFLEARCEVGPVIAAEIRRLCAQAGGS